MLSVLLDAPEATMKLGGLLGRILASWPVDTLPALYLYGDLGAGKTTLVRGLAAALPGGDRAEVASPSFTLCHEYPTSPPILHADLYRLAPGSFLPEELDEAEGLLALEWPERLTASALAPDRLDVELRPQRAEPGADPSENLDIPGQACERKRLARITAHGERARRLLDELRPLVEACCAAGRSSVFPPARAPDPA
ncbi:MAG: tRNA (adenosine(37)-N6)-threonylcarbamoyltransferase complex ATPase subunit type 1 TsaE [Desulfovibrionaceae bacterium]|nr:tRNA (adenosine(37)-N6)-threonylcarbamoyltransferase complex ATPase subunit type 1 TsaE [Desulfovibrionaceae bacterium]